MLKDVVRHLWNIVFAYETSQLLAVETNKQPRCLKPAAASRVGAKCLLTLKKFCFCHVDMSNILGGNNTEQSITLKCLLSLNTIFTKYSI